MIRALKDSHTPDGHWPALASAGCACLFVVLLVLAVMQYRWIAELRAAERRQMEVSVRATATRFAEEVVSELLRVATAFQLDYRSPWESAEMQLKDAYEQWMGSATHPRLIRDLVIVRPAESDFLVFRFQPKSGTIEPIQWLAILDPLKEELTRYSRTESNRWRSSAYRRNPIFLERIPALAAPFVLTETGAVRTRDLVVWILVELDGDFLVQQILPSLFEAHFAAENPAPYRIAIASAEKPRRVIYQSESFSEADMDSADLALDLITEVNGRLKIAGPQRVQIEAPETPQWRLFVKHQMGSLDAAVQNIRRRDLAISAAILLILAASGALIAVAARRARMLAELQVEFAAAVSHELRTPLAVIRSAAYNLEQGFVGDQAQIRHYASLVQDAGRRLSKMVDQVLLFTQVEAKPGAKAMVPVDVTEIVNTAVDSVTGDNSKLVEKDVPSGNPRALADPVLLAHCIQNVIINGIKYGEASEEKPMRITVCMDSIAREIQIRIADRGPGISEPDLPHIFKPFYRGDRAAADPTGNGLGLALVRRLMEKQHGRVSVQNTTQGVTFILHLQMSS
jgi:signal transduction histidine kinase